MSEIVGTKGGSQLTIKDNILYSDGLYIQLSNIAYTITEHRPFPKFSIWYIILFVIGLQSYTNIVGIIFLVPLIVYIILWIKALNGWGLNLHLNSGEIIIFTSQDEKFLEQANEEISTCVRKKECIYIDFNKCTINKNLNVEFQGNVNTVKNINIDNKE